MVYAIDFSWLGLLVELERIVSLEVMISTAVTSGVSAPFS